MLLFCFQHSFYMYQLKVMKNLSSSVWHRELGHAGKTFTVPWPQGSTVAGQLSPQVELLLYAAIVNSALNIFVQSFVEVKIHCSYSFDIHTTPSFANGSPLKLGSSSRHKPSCVVVCLLSGTTECSHGFALLCIWRQAFLRGVPFSLSGKWFLRDHDLGTRGAHYHGAGQFLGLFSGKKQEMLLLFQRKNVLILILPI